MRVVNVCGFNLSGCTAAFDLLYDYENVGSANSEFHESGFLKCPHTFGWAIQNILLGIRQPISKELMFASLRGEVHESLGELSKDLAVHNHLMSRKSMSQQYGQSYDDFTRLSLNLIPDNINELERNVALAHLSAATTEWLRLMVDKVPPSHFHNKKRCKNNVVLLKNDPPGKFPYVASLIPNGITICVIRDPMDSCFDYNRFYHFGHNMDSVLAYCRIFGSWIRTAKNQIEEFVELVQGKYYVVKFEDLIQKTQVQNEILNLLELDKVKKVTNIFSPMLSKKNIGIGCELDKELQLVVKRECGPEYNSFLDMTRKLSMLIE